jgi:hypothetical protein
MRGVSAKVNEEERPEGIDDLEKIPFEHLVIEDIQMMGDEIIRLQESGVLGHLKHDYHMDKRKEDPRKEEGKLTVASNSSKDLFLAALATAAMASISMVPVWLPEYFIPYFPDNRLWTSLA